MTAEATERTHASGFQGALRIIEWEGDPSPWDGFVSTAPASTFCHRADWKKIMTDVLGHQALYLVAIDESERWRGVLPLVRVRGLPGHYLISLPFLNDGGPLGEAFAQEALVGYAVAEAKRSGAGLLELRTRRDVPGPVHSSHRKISVHLSLPSSVDELWKSTYRAKLRSQIRRPAREGMVFRVGADELGAFYEVFARNMRDLGTPVLARGFFEAMASAFGEDAVFATVYTATGVPAAAACCLVWRDEIEVTWASSIRELNHLSPNMLLYSGLMEMAIGRGLRDFNFGRCTTGSATHRFKHQWGGRDISLPWPSWSRDGATGVPTADRPVYKLATAVWRHLPLAVSNRVGPKLARLVP